MSKKIVVVCPKCNNNMEISIEQKNSRIECSACNDTFMAFEAVICNECGKFRHPNHRCKCCIPEDASTIEYFEKQNWYNPLSWGMTPELKEKIENEKKREQEIAEVFNRLPEDIKTVLEYETDKYEKLLTSMRDRIEELENTVSDLESEIENLKEKDE